MMVPMTPRVHLGWGAAAMQATALRSVNLVVPTVRRVTDMLILGVAF